MTTKFHKPIAQRLLSYSVYVEQWDEEAGDTHLLLGFREMLRDHASELSAKQLDEMRLVDDRVLALVAANSTAQSWDIAMLRKTAELIEQERAKALQAASDLHRQAA